jgi:hypothetical protein
MNNRHSFLNAVASAFIDICSTIILFNINSRIQEWKSKATPPVENVS